MLWFTINSHAATNPRWVERVYYKLRCPAGVFIVHCTQTVANQVQSSSTIVIIRS